VDDYFESCAGKGDRTRYPRPLVNSVTATIGRDSDGSRPFFAAMATGVIAIVVYGFSFTIRNNLFRPPYPRPWILYVHAVVFSTWVLVFGVQTALAWSRRVALHRRLGVYGLAFGAAIPPLGVATAVAMTRLRVAHGELDTAAAILIPLFDMVGFTIAFGLGAVWRRWPEWHRRLMFVATCTLTAAAFGRMPFLDYGEWFYAGVDALIAIGVARDLIVVRDVHPVYRYALPTIVAGQLLTAYVHRLSWWTASAPSQFH